MMRGLSLSLGLFAAAALAGCATVEPVEPGEASLELGTGSWRFEPLEDGETLELVRGAQGGWHVWLSVRVEGMAGEPPPLRFTMQPSDESRGADSFEVALRFDPPREDGARQLVGYTGIVSDPACLVGELLRVEVEMPGPDGAMLRSERDVRVAGGAYPPPACESLTEPGAPSP